MAPKPMELPEAVIAQAEAAAAETQRDDEGHRSHADSEISKGDEAKLNTAANKHMCVPINLCCGSICLVSFVVKLIATPRSQRYQCSSNHQNPIL